MEDNAILLKIKRDFNTNEAVQSLLKIISNLEIEIGVLKSEVLEAQDKAEKIRKERTLTKKQWMQEEMFQYLNQEHENLIAKVKEYKQSMEDWKAKYFSLVLSSSKNTSQMQSQYNG